MKIREYLLSQIKGTTYIELILSFAAVYIKYVLFIIFQQEKIEKLDPV